VGDGDEIGPRKILGIVNCPQKLKLIDEVQELLSRAGLTGVE